MGLHYAHTLTLLLLNLCNNTNPMWPYFNIWSLTRTPASTPAWSVLAIMRHPQTYTAFMLKQSDCMLVRTVVKAFSLVTMPTPYWPEIKHHPTSFHHILCENVFY